MIYRLGMCNQIQKDDRWGEFMIDAVSAGDEESTSQEAFEKRMMRKC